MDDVAKQVSRDRSIGCGRCKSRPCICGGHSFELGALMMAVGRYLHGADFSVEQLGAAYRELAVEVPGQYCNGCKVCPPARGI